MSDSSDRAKDVCFVVAPIGDRNAEVGTEQRTSYEEGVRIFEQVIEPACKAVRLEPARSDRVARPGEIPEQIFRHLRDARAVVADLTGGNANVMYELGLRHSRNLLTVQIGQAGRLPFDVAAIRTLQFVPTEGGLIEAREGLTALLRTGLRGEFDPVSATRIWEEQEEAGSGDVVLVGEDEDEDEPGFLERLATMEETLPQTVVTMNDMKGVSEELSELMNGVTDEVRRSDEAGGGAAQRLAIAIKFAKDLDEHSEALEGLAETYQEQMRSIDPGVSYILDQLEEDPQQKSEVGEFLETLASLGPVFQQFSDSVEGNAALVYDLGRIARPMRAPTRRMAAALRKTASASIVAQNWAARAGRLMEED